MGGAVRGRVGVGPERGLALQHLDLALQSEAVGALGTEPDEPSLRPPLPGRPGISSGSGPSQWVPVRASGPCTAEAYAVRASVQRCQASAAVSAAVM
ncbi:hypothetical protein GCM10025734_61870 [Kitasatospora paranensis]